MTMTTEWSLSAEALAEYTAEDGTVFQQVLETVHWRVTATDDATGESITIYPSRPMQAPILTFLCCWKCRMKKSARRSLAGRS